jgi:glycosyltransferase involved in cell wall biosynthesis
MHIVLIVDTYAPSSSSAAARLMQELANALVDRGHRVTLLTPVPDLQSPTTIRDEEGVRIIRVRAGTAKGKGNFARGIAEMLFGFQMLAAAKAVRLDDDPPDWVVWYSPSIFFGPVVRWIKRRFKARTYLVLRDIFPEWAVETGALTAAPVIGFLKAIAGFQYGLADVIGIQAEGDRAYLNQYSTKARIELLPNWIKQETIPPADQSLADAFGTGGRKVIVFGGALGPAQDPDNIVRLANNLKDRTDICFLILGDGDRSAFEFKVKDLGLTNMILAPGVSQTRFKQILRLADLGLVSLHKDLRTHNIPGRFLSHLEAGLPTLASINANNDLANLIQANHCGIVVGNSDDDALHKAVRLYFDDPDRRAAMSAAASKLAARFQPEAIAAQIELSLSRL